VEIERFFMCVAIPAKVKSIEGSLAEVEVGGISRTISIGLTPEVRKDDYVLVHAGFAIHKIDEEEARQTLELFEELGTLEEGSRVPGVEGSSEKT
jgi:hydrogenase expression/formation protein HypC